MRSWTAGWRVFLEKGTIGLALVQLTLKEDAWGAADFGGSTLQPHEFWGSTTRVGTTRRHV
jgi:hypothetical protein